MAQSIPDIDTAGAAARWAHVVNRLRGSPVQMDVRRYRAAVAAVADHEPELRALTDGALSGRAAALRGRARAGEPPDRPRVEWYALAREAARRAIGERPYDTQVLGAIALDDGCVVEMQTGEGKTLAAVLPASLNALTGRGVHVLTFNDYLAGRDAEWMAPVYRLLGLSVRSIGEGLSRAARREAYGADVTYVTAREAGFDRLRDLLARTPHDLVHRPTFHLAIADEADSLLIDEAVVPLVLAGSTGRHDDDETQRLATVVSSLSPGVHFDEDEYGRSVALTDAGVERVEQAYRRGRLHDEANVDLLCGVNCALHARVLLRRDVDYIVRAGRIQMIDARTGRVVRDRQWPDGLQAALEAKEGLRRRTDGRILATLTMQRFLRGYERLCGMTGTAQDAAGELHGTYGLRVVVVPPHRPVVRVDRPDQIYTHRAAKERAVLAAIAEAHAIGRPVLAGTASVAESEALAGQLQAAGVPCEVLNARHDAREAALVARAGAIGAVTISTNMAGRGTDIRLGGADQADHDRVAALGGLYVIGTNRHESRRIDLQLRGRAGRQGDPGESRFFVSLEDDLLARYGIAQLIPRRSRPEPSDHPIRGVAVEREVARTQRIVEGQEYEIRRTLTRYAEVLERQHAMLAERRYAVLTGLEVPAVWSGAPRRALAAGAGEAAVVEAERTVTLSCLDAAWSDHLAFCADLREGIHLVRLAGEDPLTRFAREAIAAFDGIHQRIDDAVLAALPKVELADGRIDLSRADLEVPSSTWTYLVNDDPFRNTIGALLTGPGGATAAIYAAALLTPLLLLWGIVERWFRRRA